MVLVPLLITFGSGLITPVKSIPGNLAHCHGATIPSAVHDRVREVAPEGGDTSTHLRPTPVAGVLAAPNTRSCPKAAHAMT